MRQFVKRAFRHFGYDILRAGQLSGQLNEAVEVIGEYLSDASVIFDIGANVGESSHAFRSMYTGHASYDLAPDGRFLMVKPEEQASVSQVNVVLNWFEELTRLVPVP